MIDISLPETNADLARLMRERLGVRGDATLAAKMRRGGRLLPRRLRQEGAYLVQMEQLWQHPRLRRQIDVDHVARAQAELRAHLTAIDPRDRMIGRILGIVAPLAFNLLLIGALVIAWLAWTGRV
ncbi:hypothetical protein [Tropicimonas sp. IMCC34043]|uniref:hypothetical protein n=1 Tax=Tropicimonas sp. IMCC34043 TaxID=2248760 RepID=UPI000E27029C|nr:hypothetical protein [Tropicimonas sp. IMCC34043]